jgi:hypothetical protein
MLFFDPNVLISGMEVELLESLGRRMPWIAPSEAMAKGEE